MWQPRIDLTPNEQREAVRYWFDGVATGPINPETQFLIEFLQEAAVGVLFP